MSDQKKFESMMGRHVQGQVNRQAQQQYSQQAQQYFAKPANTCQCCGGAMQFEPGTQQPHVLTEWERKYSVHRPCAELAAAQLDRVTGINTDRR
jgi:exopolysaccharide biosynthesis predicted pyruvyltransferase EpsI